MGKNVGFKENGAGKHHHSHNNGYTNPFAPQKG